MSEHRPSCCGKVKVVKEINKRKFGAASYSAAEENLYRHLAFGGVIT